MPQEWTVESYQLSDTGQKRQHNEDYVGFFEPDQLEELAVSGRLYLVADGVGGAASGEVASQYAVKKILYNFYNSPEPDLKTRLLNVIQDANTDIFERNSRHPEHREMATTLVAALVHGDNLLVANVGDSRAYLVRGESIEQISQDHSFVEQLVREGEISAEEAKLHPNRNRILRSLGIDERVKVDIFSRQLGVGDIIVLCSDGLTKYVLDNEIAQTATKYPPEKAAHRLIELANARGGKDNISASVTQILVEPVTKAPLPHGQLPPRPDWDNLSETVTKPHPSSSLHHNKLHQLIAFGIALVLVCAVAILGSELIMLGGGPTNLPSVFSTPTQEIPAVVEYITANPPPPTSTATEPAPTTTSPLPSPTIIPTPSLTPEPTLVIATCPGEDSLRFEADESYADGSQVAPGEAFVKKWQVTNDGKCLWTSEYRLVFVGGESMSEGQAVSVPKTEVGVSTIISVPMTAPTESGIHTGWWQMHTSTDKPFGDQLYVKIEVITPQPTEVNVSQPTSTIYDFIKNATEATWSAGDITYTPVFTDIGPGLVPPLTGTVAIGKAQLPSGYPSPDAVLLTHPVQQPGGFIQGTYVVTTPLQPTDLISATLGFPTLASGNKDGVTFEVIFVPTDAAGLPETVIFTRTVTYADDIVSLAEPLKNIQPGQKGTFTLRVRAEDNPSYDWALWIDLRLVRP